MLTRNYYGLLAACMNLANADNTFTLKDITNADKNIYVYDGASSRYTYRLFLWLGLNSSGQANKFKTWTSDISTFNNHTYNAVCFGDGNTEPTLDDYNLSGNHITTLTELGRNVTTNYDKANNKFEVSLTFTLQNNGSETVTIREVAYFDFLYATPSSQYVAMMDRSLLASPVTIPAGATGVVTYKFAFNFPKA